MATSTRPVNMATSPHPITMATSTHTISIGISAQHIAIATSAHPSNMGTSTLPITMAASACPITVSADDIPAASIGVTITPFGDIVVGGYSDVKVYSSAVKELWTLGRPVGVKVWSPWGITATSTSVLVANCVPVELGGGVYRYPVHGGVTGTLEVACKEPRDVAVVQYENSMEELVCLSGRPGQPGNVSVYISSVPGSASLPHRRPTVCRADDDALSDPWYIAVNSVTEEILVTHRTGTHGAGVTAMSSRDLHTVWSYTCREDGQDGDLRVPRGVCVDEEGRVYVADCRDNRVVVLTGDGQYITTIVLPGGAGQMEGLTITSDHRLRIVDWSRGKLLSVCGVDCQLLSVVSANLKRQRDEIEILKEENKTLRGLVKKLKKGNRSLTEELEKFKETAAIGEKDCDILIKNRTFLLEQLDPNHIIDYLLQENILLQHDYEVIQSKVTRKEKARTLLDTLPYRGPSAYTVFKKALQQDWSHIVQHLENT